MRTIHQFVIFFEGQVSDIKLGFEFDGLRNDIERIDHVVGAVIFDRGAWAREVLSRFGVEIVFVVKAADEFAALSRKLRDIEGKHLVLGFRDGNAIELVKEG